MEIPERPSVRPTEVLPVERDGEKLFVLRDPLGFADPVVMPVAAMALVSFLDGERTLLEVQAEFARHFGAIVTHEQLGEVLATLDRAHLVEGPSFDAYREKMVAEFRAAPTRPCQGAGTSYPGEPVELADYLERVFHREGGPKQTPRAAEPTGAPVVGLVSPHIDFERGGPCYGHAWGRLARSCRASTFVVFGTAHAGTDGRFALARKDYETPFGAVPCAVERVDAIAAAYEGPGDLFASEYAHRVEHSIEFQAVLLAHLYAGRREIRIVPVLCGSLLDLIASGGPVGEDEAFVRFIDAVEKAFADLPAADLCFIAGADLSHLGAQFQEPPLTEAALESVSLRDRETLERVVQLDLEGFHRDIASDADARKICGHSPIAATIAALARRGRPTGSLLHYDRWYDGASAVTFAALAFESPEEAT